MSFNDIYEDLSEVEDFGLVFFGTNAGNAESHQKQKRKSIMIETKLQLIDASADGAKTHELVQRFGFDRSVVKRIVAKKEKIKQAYRDGIGAKRMKLRTAKFQEVEEKTLHWARSMRSRNIVIAGEHLKVRHFVGKLRFNRDLR